MNTKKALIAISVIVLVAITGILALILRDRMNSVKPNSFGTIGNTSGNLQNNGLFVTSQSDGRIYFSNTFDNGYIYSMKPDESDIRREEIISASKLMSAGDYLYYYMDSSSGGKGLGFVIGSRGLYRLNKKNGKIVSLDKSPILSMQLIENNIYYLKGDETGVTRLYRIGIQKTKPEKISDLAIYPYTANDGVMYFAGNENDHYLYAFDTTSSSARTVYRGDLCNPQYAGGYIYYLDYSGNYRLCRLKLSTGEVQILTKDRVDVYNASENYVFYQRNDKTEPCLIRMWADGSNSEIIAKGVFCDINTTGQYVYFRSFSDQNTLYHAPLSHGAASEFTEAAQAILLTNE